MSIIIRECVLCNWLQVSLVASDVAPTRGFEFYGVSSSNGSIFKYDLPIFFLSIVHKESFDHFLRNWYLRVRRKKRRKYAEKFASIWDEWRYTNELNCGQCTRWMHCRSTLIAAGCRRTGRDNSIAEHPILLKFLRDKLTLTLNDPFT